MNFREQVEADFRNVLLNPDEFGHECDWDGKKIVIVDYASPAIVADTDETTGVIAVTRTVCCLESDYGSLGAFVAYLIWQRNADNKQRIKDNERWLVLDERIINLTVECTRVMMKVEAALSKVASGRIYIERDSGSGRGTTIVKRGE